MADSGAASVRRWANRLLPRPVVEQLGRLAAFYERRKHLRHLDGAVAAFDQAYLRYWETGVVPPSAEDLLFLAAWASSGVVTQERSREHGIPFDPDVFSCFSNDLLSDLDPAVIASEVEAHGCYVSHIRLPDAIVAAIADVLDTGPACPRGDGLAGAIQPGQPRPAAPTWWMSPAEAIRSAGVRRLLRERALPLIAGEYLGVDPMVMSIALWKSFAWRRADKSSAQHFHHDNDRAGFLKMFIYLTDVGPSNGPHVFVRGSHRTKPRALMHGQRLSDEAVRSFYPEESWSRITGPKGTVFFADTHGFHKGGHVAEGHRSMLQINIGSDRFGTFEAPVGPAAEAPEDLAEVLAASPRYFSQIFVPDQLVP